MVSLLPLFVEDEDEDAARVVNEAIAFLDGWQDDVAVNSTEHNEQVDIETACSSGESCDGLTDSDASTSSPSSTTVDVPAPLDAEPLSPPVKRPRTTTERRKDEIRLLRVEAQALKLRVECLRILRATSHQSVQRFLPAPGYAKKVALATMWKDVALRQKRLRSLADMENTRLRAEVADQEMTLKAIHSMLQRHRRQERASSSRAMSKCTSVSSRAILGADTIQLLEQFCDQVEATYLTKHPELVTAAGSVYSSATPRAVQISPTKFVIAISQSRMMPFQFRDVAAALWSAMDQSCPSSDSRIEQEPVGQKGTFVRSNVGEHKFAGQHFELCWNSAARLRHDPKLPRVSYILAGFSQLHSINGQPASGISLRTQGTAQVSSVLNDLCLLELKFQLEVEVTPSTLSANAVYAKCFAEGLAQVNVNFCSDAYAKIESAMLRQPVPMVSACM